MAKTVLVTGSNRGIGLGLTKKYAAAGFTTIATCRNPAGSVLPELTKQYDNLSVHSLDVTNETELEELAIALEGQTVDVLLNNAGIQGSDNQGIENMDYDMWQEVLLVNTIAPFRITMKFLPNLKQSSNPKAITISSQMGALTRQSKGMYAYRTSKAAANKVMQVLSLDLADDGIICCPVHPGWVTTEMGGPNADIDLEESVEGLYALIENLTLADSGRFWTWEGTEHAW